MEQMQNVAEKQPLLCVTDIYKSFGGNHVLKGIDFTLYSGEVHAILGENGAGKSTLIKIISGALQADAGMIQINNKNVKGLTPAEAFEYGVATIYQETSLYPELSVAENLFVHKRILKGGVLDWKAMVQKSYAIFKRLGVEIDPYKRIADLGKGTAQLVEIGKALVDSANILIMDEPTASLSSNETRYLFQVIRKLKEEGTSIIYISHRLEEIFEITDCVTILYNGTVAGTSKTDQIDGAWISEKMLGCEIKQLYYRNFRENFGEPLLQIQGLSSGTLFQDINLTVHAGEIVALAGLVGSGRTEVARTVFGIDTYASGDIIFCGRSIKHARTKDLIDSGIGLVPEDRGRYGLVLDVDVSHNIILASLRKLSRRFLGIRKRRSEAEMVERVSNNLLLKPNDPTLLGNAFSGGNQQKIVIGKWLGIAPKLLIMDEPTCGVDIGAKLEIYKIMDHLAESGVGILLISSDFAEIEHMSDQIVVMKKGRITQHLPRGTKANDIFLSATRKEVSACV
jgi:ABC-type sugar transport system ATPase subunit